MSDNLNDIFGQLKMLSLVVYKCVAVSFTKYSNLIVTGIISIVWFCRVWLGQMVGSWTLMSGGKGGKGGKGAKEMRGFMICRISVKQLKATLLSSLPIIRF